MHGEVDPEHGEGFEVAGVAEGGPASTGWRPAAARNGWTERLAVASLPQKKPSAARKRGHRRRQLSRNEGEVGPSAGNHAKMKFEWR